MLKSDSEVCRNGRFSNAAFTARDRDDVLYSRNSGGANTRACTGRRRVDVDQNFCAANTIELAQDFLGIVFYGRRNIGIVGGKRKLHFDVAIVDIDSLDQTKRDDVATKSRITDRAERVANLFF